MPPSRPPLLTVARDRATDNMVASSGRGNQWRNNTNMNQVAFAFYRGAAGADIAWTAVGSYDLMRRIRKLRHYVRPVSTRIGLRWNVDSNDVLQTLAAQEPAVINARTRAAFS
jgi:hypothetical protein